MTIGKIIFWIIIVAVIASAIFIGIGNAATNIDSVNRYAWNDISGWLDFYGTDSVSVFGTKVEGYASSAIGEISLDCSTTPSGNICGVSNYGICNGPGPHNADGTCPSGDGSGNLTGWAWNDAIGWISFNCDGSSHGGSNNCLSSNHRVWIDSNGDFQGWAWNDIVGWISFNCNNGNCLASNYKVNTSWRATSTFAYLESSVFDTSVLGGATLQSIVWQGTQDTGTSVDFQIALSNSPSGPWIYQGPGGSVLDYYGAECPTSGVSNPGAGPNRSICVNKNLTANYRYLRYKVRLRSNATQTFSPVIDDIILNWGE